MKKDVTMKKNTFINGALITTFGVIFTKILGVLYVIPFHALIGEKGGALYGYAYTVYSVFISLASAGIPLAISKLVSEYQALGYYNVKKRVFLLARKLALLFGMICFLIIIIFAPFFARLILGDITGGNTLEDVVFVLRVIGTAILIVPVLGVYRGYFEGHRFMSPPSISQILEQLLRVSIIIFGSLFAVKYFKFNLTTTVGVALFGATAGAIVSYLYLVDKKKKNEIKFNEKIRNVNEPIVTNKEIFRKIFRTGIYRDLQVKLREAEKASWKEYDRLKSSIIQYLDGVIYDESFVCAEEFDELKKAKYQGQTERALELLALLITDTTGKLESIKKQEELN